VKLPVVSGEKAIKAFLNAGLTIDEIVNLL